LRKQVSVVPIACCLLSSASDRSNPLPTSRLHGVPGRRHLISRDTQFLSEHEERYRSALEEEHDQIDAKVHDN